MANPHKNIFKENLPAPNMSNTIGANENAERMISSASKGIGVRHPPRGRSRSDQTKTR